MLVVYGVMSLLAAALVLEVIVRVVRPQQLIVEAPELYRMDYHGFGWKHQAHVDTVINRGEGAVRVVTDAKGFRVREPDLPPRQPAYRILAVGDSFVEGVQVPYDQTMGAHIERKLAAHLGKEVEVVNTGVAGWEPNHYLFQVREELAISRYDVVLVFIYSGDDVEGRLVEAYPPLDRLRKPDMRLPKTLTRQEITDSWLYPVNDFLKSHSHLFMVVKNNAPGLLTRLGLAPYYISNAIKRSYADSPAWMIVRGLATLIQDEVAKHDVPVVFVHLPSPLQVDEAMLAWHLDTFRLDPAEIDVDQPSRILARSFDAYKLTLIDAQAPLRAAYHAGVDGLYGTIDRHFATNGHRVAGEFVADWLIAHVLQPDSPSPSHGEGLGGEVKTGARAGGAGQGADQTRIR